MKILIVEDTPETVRAIQDHCTEMNWEASLCSFEMFEGQLNEFAPDVIVLDWKEDITEESYGEHTLEMIWATGFKPVIIFSAVAETIVLDPRYKTSNLIHIQPKGDEEPVITYLDSISPFIPVISGLKDDFNNALIQALNSINMMSKANLLTDNVMRYIFAKRVSNYFDRECADEAPPPWIQYSYPAIARTLCVCDIIRSIPADGIVNQIGAPEEYKIILTPSCDLAQENVSHALCANCYPKTLFHSYPPRENPTTKQIDSIISNLNAG